MRDVFLSLLKNNESPQKWRALVFVFARKKLLMFILEHGLKFSLVFSRAFLFRFVFS